MPIHHWQLQLHLYQHWIFSQKKLPSAKKSMQMHTTHLPDLFFTYRVGFNMNTGNRIPNDADENPLHSQRSTSPPKVF